MFGKDSAEVIVPVVMFVMIFSIPLVKSFLKHQKSMAELFAKNQNHDPVEIQRLREEVAYLRDKVNQQALSLDGVRAIAMGGGSDRIADANVPDYSSDSEPSVQVQ